MSGALFQVNRKRLADQIADRLLAMIADDTLKPGDRLPSEPELMKQFKVGRSSIREAIGALSLVGLVTVRPGQGTHVARSLPERGMKPLGLLGIGRDRVGELVEARIELERVIVRLAAERATTEDLAEIRRAHGLLGEALDRRLEPIKADLAFHTAIAAACHNTVLIRFFTEMRQPIRQWMEQKARHDWGYSQVLEQHEAILAALEKRDREGAEKALGEHLRSTGERLIAALLDPQPV